MQTVAEAIRRNRKRYKRRVTKKLAELREALEGEAHILERQIVEAAEDKCLQWILRHTACPKVHASLRALDGFVEPEHANIIVRAWAQSRAWGNNLDIRADTHYGLIVVRWPYT